MMSLTTEAQMKRLLALLLVLFLASPCVGEIKITSEHVVLNKNGLSCAWCSLESLARYHNNTHLALLASQRNTASYMYELEAVVRQAGLDLWKVNNPDGMFLWKVTRAHGAVVGLLPAHPGGMGHAVLLTEINSEYAVYLDSNDGLLHTVTYDWFMSRWDRSYLVPCQ